MRGPDISELTGLRSSTPSWYAEYRQTVDDLARALGWLEHIAGVLSATGQGAQALCRAVVDAAAEHLGEPWAVLALSGTALPLARPRMLGRGPSGVGVGHLALLPEVVRRPVLEALDADAVEPWQTADGAVVVPLVVDGEPVGALVACGGPRRTATPADLAILRIAANQSAVALLSDHLLARSEGLRRQTEELCAQAEQRARDLADRHERLADAERRLDVAAQREAVDAERHRIGPGWAGCGWRSGCRGTPSMAEATQGTADGTTTETIRLVIVDDHAIVRRGLRSILEREPDIEVVGEAASAGEALDLVAASRPHIVLLDLELSAGSDVAGLALCGRLTAATPAPGVLVVTTFLDQQLVLEAIQRGARGYVLKDVDEVALVAAIRAVRRGESAFDSHSATMVVRSLAAAAPSPVVAAGPDLTAREREVLALLARGLSNETIGRELYISATTAKFHVGNVMRKLAVSRRAEAVYVGSKLGLI